MVASRDVVIIGAGHNGLVAAFYLAKAGFKPLVLERRDTIGGAAITEEFAPGFRCSILAHSTGPLLPEIVREMDLASHGLQMIEPEPRVFAPAPDGRAAVLYSDVRRSAESIRKLSNADAGGYERLHGALARAATVLRPLLTITPPSIDRPAQSKGDLWKLLQTGRSFRKLGKKEMFQLLRWGPMAVADFVAEFFETDLLRATIAARGIFGTAFGPWSAGSTATLLLRSAAEPNPAGTSAFPKGGLGALTAAMAAAARQSGAEIRKGAAVEKVLVKDGVATGVALTSGEEIAARAVVSGADPRHTFLKLVDPLHLDPEFVVKARNYRCVGNVAKLNLALSGLPEFTAIAKMGGDGEPARILSGRTHIGPGIDYLERAFDATKYGEISEHPCLEVSIPSLLDPSLAPAGKHVMSIYAQFAPYKLKKGDWESRADDLAKTVVHTLADYAPKLPRMIEAQQVITPLDLERTYGLTGGHIFHGELALDQLFTMRPIIDWSRYRAPVKGLYLCGSGTHPGTGLTGASGYNAAREILRDLRR